MTHLHDISIQIIRAGQAPGGGYVFGSVHNVQANVPPAHVIAMYDTVLDYQLP